MKTPCPDVSPWRLSWRTDPRARVIADRHYSRQSPGHPNFMPPGRCFVLITHDLSAVWGTSWPFTEYAQHEWAGAWVNSLFRNEGDYLSSDLIRHAVAHTRWNPHWQAPPPGTGIRHVRRRRRGAAETGSGPLLPQGGLAARRIHQDRASVGLPAVAGSDAASRAGAWLADGTVLA